MGTIGPERTTEYCDQRPAAYTAGSGGTNGRPVDGRLMQTMMGEAGHLVHESCRHLATSAAFEPVPFATIDDPWKNLPGIEAPAKQAAGTEFADHLMIPWDRRTAARFPVTHAIEDRTDADGNARMRTVAFRMHVLLGATLSKADAFFAITFDPSPRSITGDEDAFARVPLAAFIGTDTMVEADLSLVVAVPPPTKMRATVAARLGAYATVTPFWVWFGWRLIGPNDGTSAILALSAFETR